MGWLGDCWLESANHIVLHAVTAFHEAKFMIGSVMESLRFLSPALTSLIGSIDAIDAIVGGPGLAFETWVFRYTQ